MVDKTDALIFAPTPPQPPGGIGSIVAILHQSIGHGNSVSFFSPIAKGSGLFTWITRPVLNIFRLYRAAGNVKKGGRVLFFSSSGVSFFEKILWVLIVILRGRRSSMVMVDGNFPDFWDKCSPVLKKLSKFILSNHNIELGTQSEEWKKFYQSILPSSSIKVVGATVGDNFFEHSHPIDSSRRKFNILYVGWIIEDKGILDLLDAMVILSNSNPEAKLRLVGPLFGKEDFWNGAVAERKIATQVEFLGSCSNRQILIDEFNAASIFVFPSHFEGFPVALLEAITMGLACVGTSVGGIPDILDHGNAGIVVAPKAPIELAGALKSLLDDNELVTMLSKQASIRARSVYNLKECVDSYKKLLGLRG
jgi:glycosyltransferase involved in cell wall biosynthesis